MLLRYSRLLLKGKTARPLPGATSLKSAAPAVKLKLADTLREMSATLGSFECIRDVAAGIAARGHDLDATVSAADLRALVEANGVAIRHTAPSALSRSKALGKAIKQLGLRTVCDVRKWWCEEYKRSCDPTLVDMDLLAAGYIKEHADFSGATAAATKADEALLDAAKAAYGVDDPSAAPSSRLRALRDLLVQPAPNAKKGTTSPNKKDAKKKAVAISPPATKPSVPADDVQLYEALSRLGVRFSLAFDDVSASFVVEEARTLFQSDAAATEIPRGLRHLDGDAVRRWLSPGLELKVIPTFTAVPPPPRSETLQTPGSFFDRAAAENDANERAAAPAPQVPIQQGKPAAAGSAAAAATQPTSAVPPVVSTYKWSEDTVVASTVTIVRNSGSALEVTAVSSPPTPGVTTKHTATVMLTRGSTTDRHSSAARTVVVGSTLRDATRRAVCRAMRPSAFPVRPPPDLSGAGPLQTAVEELLDIAHEAAVSVGQLPDWSLQLKRVPAEGSSASSSSSSGGGGVELVRGRAVVRGAEVGTWTGSASGVALRGAIAIAEAHVQSVPDAAAKERLESLMKEALASATEFNGMVQPIPALQTALRRLLGAELDTSVVPLTNASGTTVGFRATVVLRGQMDVEGGDGPTTVDRMRIGDGVSGSKKGAIREASIAALLQTLTDVDRERVSKHPAFEPVDASDVLRLVQPSPLPLPDTATAAAPSDTAVPFDGNTNVAPPTEVFVARNIITCSTDAMALLANVARERNVTFFEEHMGQPNMLHRSRIFVPASGPTPKLALIAVAHLADATASRHLAAAKALAVLFPDVFAQKCDQLPSLDADSSHANKGREGGGAAASELSRLRRAVQSAVNDAYGDDAQVKEVEQAAASGGVEVLVCVGGDVVGRGTGPHRLSATLRAYRGAFASPLMEDDAQRWNPQWASVAGGEVAATGDGSTRRRAALSGHGEVPWAAGVAEHENVRAAVEHLYGASLMLSARVENAVQTTELTALESRRPQLLFKASSSTGNTTEEDSSYRQVWKLCLTHLLLPVLPTSRQDELKASFSFGADRFALQPSVAAHRIDTTVDGALRMVSSTENAAVDIPKIELKVSQANCFCSEATVEWGGNRFTVAARDDNAAQGPFVTLRRAICAATESPNQTTVLEAASQLATHHTVRAAGPAGMAAYLVARHHGLRLCFNVTREPVQSQPVWRASAVVCCDSRDLDAAAFPKVLEISMPGDETTTANAAGTLRSEVLDGAAVRGLRVGPMAWGDSKKGAMLKAAVRFLEANYPRELAASRATYPMLYAPCAHSEAVEQHHVRMLSKNTPTYQTGEQVPATSAEAVTPTERASALPASSPLKFVEPQASADPSFVMALSAALQKACDTIVETQVEKVDSGWRASVLLGGKPSTQASAAAPGSALLSALSAELSVRSPKALFKLLRSNPLLHDAMVENDATIAFVHVES